MQDVVQKSSIMSIEGAPDSSSSDDYESFEENEEYINPRQTKSREAWCTPLDLEVHPKVNQSWASEMSLYDKMSPQRSMDSIKIPRTPVTIPTPEEFKRINWKMMSSDSFKHTSILEKIEPNDNAIVKELQQEKGEKPNGARLSFSCLAESEERIEVARRIDLVDEEPSERSKTPSSTESKQSSSESKTPSSTESKPSSSEPILDYKNLLVNYLPPDMDSTVLRSLFLPYGTIVSSKVVVDHASGVSKGYGFVKFKTAEDGIRAQKALHQYRIGRKTLKVSFSRRLQSSENTKHNTNLYLSNLDPRMEKEDLERHFKTCGYVVQCKVLRNAKGISKQIGFVRYGDAESAQRAIDMFDGQQLEGTDRRIKIRIAATPRAPPGWDAFQDFGSSITPHYSPPRVNSTSSACYVTGFHVSLSEKVLRKVFEPVGGKKVKSIRIIRRQNAPYAFINFFNSEDAAEAAYAFNNLNLGDCILTVRLQT